MKYISQTITITLSDVSGYSDTDYVKLVTNRGLGVPIDWSDFVDGRKFSCASDVSVPFLVTTAGDWRFGFRAFDRLGNPDAGPNVSDSEYIDLVPAAPSGLAFVSYHPISDVLVLELV